MSRDDRPDGEDLDIWVESLAGRKGTAAREASRHVAAAVEAEALRAGILARPIEATEPVPERDPQREDALIARARREGLLPPHSIVRPRRVAWRYAALAAAAAVLVVAGVLYRTIQRPAEEVVRGAEGGIVRLTSPDPAALRDQIAVELRRAGIESIRYERLGRYGLDAEIPVPVPFLIADVLRRHGIPLPRDGALAIEIAPAAPGQ